MWAFLFYLQLLPEIFFIIRRNKQGMILKNVCWSSCSYPLFLFDCNETWIFSMDFRNIFKNQILIKSLQWEPSCFMRTDRHDEANSRFRNFTNVHSRITCMYNYQKLLNKRYIYCCLKCIVYDKLLKPRQSFWITLYRMSVRRNENIKSL